MVKCSKCFTAVVPKAEWEMACGNNHNIEYLCPHCKYHWVDRYILSNRDIINEGEKV